MRDRLTLVEQDWLSVLVQGGLRVSPHFCFHFRFLMFPLLEMLELFELLESLELLGLQTGLCLQDCPQMELEEVSDVAPAANEGAMVPLMDFLS